MKSNKSVFFLNISAPNDHLLVSNRSHAHAALNQYQSALKDAELAITIRPDWPKVKQ